MICTTGGVLAAACESISADNAASKPASIAPGSVLSGRMELSC